MTLAPSTYDLELFTMLLLVSSSLGVLGIALGAAALFAARGVSSSAQKGEFPRPPHLAANCKVRWPDIGEAPV